MTFAVARGFGEDIVWEKMRSKKTIWQGQTGSPLVIGLAISPPCMWAALVLADQNSHQPAFIASEADMAP